MWWHLIVHLICISLSTHEVDYLFCVLIGHSGIFSVSLLIEPETRGTIVLLGGSSCAEDR